MGIAHPPQELGGFLEPIWQETTMNLRSLTVVLAILLLFPACGSRKEVKPWDPGDSIICPHCGREFPVPEKMGR
jgi:hypothetical protein